MRTNRHLVAKAIIAFAIFCFCKTSCLGQGRVVINEYMPWTPSACNATADFVELLNFGPGPVNIGCYVLTDGDYAITIPSNTILQPGEFYVLSGQDIITAPCANIDSTIHVDLNWTTCSCTSGTIPTTGDGFLTDGGSANEQLVLFDASMNVIDAVARSLPVEPSALITTSTVGGSCAPHSFDLDLISINYETIGESAGRGNSFARRLDGDCGWVKDPQQSGNATNNTPGDVSDVSYSFYYTKSQACPNDGSISVVVHASDYSSVFPMSYTLAYDSDNDGVFEITDSYTNGSVSNPNTITISNLTQGTYRLTVASVKGCYLQTFPFTILGCVDVLPLRLTAFNVAQNNHSIECKWAVEHVENLEEITIERSADGIHFSLFTTIAVPLATNGRWNYAYRFNEDNILLPYFRLILRNKNGTNTYSWVSRLSQAREQAITAWPNPAVDRLNIQFLSSTTGNAELSVFNVNSTPVLRKTVSVQPGQNTFSLSTGHIPPGIYQLFLKFYNSTEPGQWIRFVKI